MKKKLFICMMLTVLFAVKSFTQTEKTFTVHTGSKITDVMQPEDIYRFPEFLKGNIFFKSGNTTESLMNYNNVLGEMEFISDRGDTLTVANREEISIITFPDNIFYVDNGYLEQLTNNKSANLYAKTYIKLNDIKSQGPYGTSMSTAAIDNYASVNTNQNTSTYFLKAQQDLVFTLNVEYYLKENESDAVRYTRKALLKLYPDYSNEIKKFIKENSIKFNTKNDLIKLTNYLTKVVI